VHDQHDHHRIGAREVLGTAGGTGPAPAGLGDLRGRAAARAEAVRVVPAEDALGGGGVAGITRIEQRHHGAQVGELQVRGQAGVAGTAQVDEARRRLGRIDRPRPVRDVAREMRRAVGAKPEKDRLARRPGNQRLGHGQPAEAQRLAARVDERLAAPDRETAGARIRAERCLRRRIAAQMGGPVQGAAGESDGLGVAHGSFLHRSRP
jgi:hypothetical protein